MLKMKKELNKKKKGENECSNASDVTKGVLLDLLVTTANQML